MISVLACHECQHYAMASSFYGKYWACDGCYEERNTIETGLLLSDEMKAEIIEALELAESHKPKGPMSLSQRAKAYNKTFPKWPPLVFTDRWLYGVWTLGNDYRNKSSYYGAFPPNFLKRLLALFPDVDERRMLHLFSGSLPKGEYTRLDCQGEAEIVGDALELAALVKPGAFKLIIADPPYTKIDSEKYGTKLPNKKKVVQECAKVLNSGDFLVWLDTSLPMYRKTEFKLVGTIGIVRSTNHRVRMLFIFERV